MSRSTSLESPGSLAVRDVLVRNPMGASARSISAAAAVSETHCKSILHKLRVCGVVSYVGGANNGRWCLMQYQSLTYAEIQAISERLRRETRNRCERRQRLGLVEVPRLSERDPVDDEEADRSPFVQRIRPAADCEPLRPSGPVSVWSYAQMV